MFSKKIGYDTIKKELWNDLQKNCAENTVSLISYGISSESGYLSLASKHNFLIVTNSLTAHNLAKFAPLQRIWAKKYKEFPLFMTVNDLKTSADIFPIELLDMRDSYTVIGGEDVLANLEIPLIYLRTQCEYSLKGKIIILRQGYLENPKRARELITNSFPAFYKVFVNILRLQNKQVPTNSVEVIQQVCQLSQTDESSFITIDQLPVAKKKLKRAEVDNLFANYLSGLQNLANYIDRFDVKE